MGDQFDMFPDMENDNEKEWNGMPEFNQENLEPAKQLIISFKTMQDYIAFGKLIDQNLTRKTQSVWWPKADIDRMMNKRYINENKEEVQKIESIEEDDEVDNICPLCQSEMRRGVAQWVCINQLCIGSIKNDDDGNN